MKIFLQFTVSTMALAMAVPGYAQSADQSAESSGLQEIIVTAQRRDQSQQNVPIAVTAVTAESAKLFGSNSTETLSNSVPSLQINRQPGIGMTPFLRGVGSSESAGAEGEVAMYIDDVYIGNTSATDMQFNNISSIEVLKGPQGTLFGRNATGGVIHIHTKDPSHDAAADMQVGYGNFNTITGNFYGTAGLSDTMAMNFSATARDQRDGYGRGVITGKDVGKEWNYGFRSKLLWQPSDTTRVLLSGEYRRLRSEAGGNWVILPGTVSVGGGTALPGRYDSNASPTDFYRDETWRVSGKLTQDFDFARLVSITSYSRTKQHMALDLDLAPDGSNILRVDVDNPAHSFSQEVQLQSPAENKAFSWILGGFYYSSWYALQQRLSGSSLAGLGGFRDLDAPLSLKSWSGFADATLEFLPDTHLTAGIRYTSDQYAIDFTTTLPSGAILLQLPHQKKTFSKPTWRAVLDHRFSPEVMAYASYSRGFKSGRFNVSDGGLVKPETLDSFEVGIKTDLLDRRLRLNLAAFHYNYKDIQVSRNVGGVNAVLNAGAARINGADMDVTFAPTRNFIINGGVSYLDAKYTSFPGGPFNVPNPETRTPTGGFTSGPPTGGFTICPLELKGRSMPQAPKFVMNVSATYTVPTSVGDFALNASLTHNGGFYWEPDNHFRNPEYNLVNAGVTWKSTSKMYELRVYGQNLLNEYYYNWFTSGPLGAVASPVPPRTYGVEATVHF